MHPVEGQAMGSTPSGGNIMCNFEHCQYVHQGSSSSLDKYNPVKEWIKEHLDNLFLANVLNKTLKMHTFCSNKTWYYCTNYFKIDCVIISSCITIKCTWQLL